MVPFWGGEFTTHVRTYFSGWIESDVHWGANRAFDPWPYGITSSRGHPRKLAVGTGALEPLELAVRKVGLAPCCKIARNPSRPVVPFFVVFGKGSLSTNQKKDAHFFPPGHWASEEPRHRWSWFLWKVNGKPPPNHPDHKLEGS